MLFVGLFLLSVAVGVSRLPGRVAWRLALFVTLIGEVFLMLPLLTLRSISELKTWLDLGIVYLYGLALAGPAAIILSAFGRKLGQRYALPYLFSLNLSDLSLELIGGGLGAIAGASLGLLGRCTLELNWTTLTAFVAGGATAGFIVANDFIRNPIYTSLDSRL